MDINQFCSCSLNNPREYSVPIYIQQDATLHSLIYLETALHVLGGTITHHQERKQLSAASGICHTVTVICRYRGRVGGTITHHQERKQLYLQHLVFVTPLLLSAAIVEELKLLFSSRSSTIAADSNNGVTNTRCCRYSCLRSWWWVMVPPETCRSVSR